MNNIIGIFMARALAVFYISFGIGMLLNQEYYKKVLLSLVKEKPFLLFSGSLAIFYGIAILQYQNNWEQAWITLLGWISLTKGIFLLTFPNAITIFQPLLNRTLPIGCLTIIIGGLLAYIGFILY